MSKPDQVQSAIDAVIARHIDEYESFLEHPFLQKVRAEAILRKEGIDNALNLFAKQANPEKQSKIFSLGGSLNVWEKIIDGSLWRTCFDGANSRIPAELRGSASTRKHFDQAIDPGRGTGSPARGRSGGSDEEWPVGSDDDGE